MLDSFFYPVLVWVTYFKRAALRIKMQIYVINLARRPDRLAFMEAQLAKLQLPFIRVDAVDGLGNDDIGYPADHSRLSKGEYACYLSHVKAWKLFIDSGAERCLVLEDDVYLSSSLPEILAHPAFFDHNGALTRLECNVFPARLSIFARHRFKNWKITRLQAYNGGSGALVLTRKYLTYLLAHHSIPEIPVDDITLNPVETDYRPHIIYQLEPAPAIQRQFLEPRHPEHARESDLQDSRGKPTSRQIPSGLFPKVKQILKQRMLNFRNNTVTKTKLIEFGKD